MSGYLLDTNHLGRLIDPRQTLRIRFRTELEAGNAFCIIAPIITEAVFGFSILPRAVQNREEWQVLRPALTLLPIDEDDAMEAAELQVILRRAGRQLATVDALIAIIALRYDLTLLTADKDFSPVTSLRLKNWLEH